MNIISQILIGFIAFLHFYIMYFEMFAWETKGPKVFNNFPKDLFPKTKSMAANQGLYNGFLAAGLVWALLIENPIWKTNVATFFLACVIIAGIYGALTVTKRIFFTQALPAIIALLLVIFI